MTSWPVSVSVGWKVYQATDTNLKRQVVIKVLPESLAGDAKRLARFQREAEVLAALNHPNIAGVYGLDRTGTTTALFRCRRKHRVVPGCARRSC
jgi:hypothetical protein